MCFIGDATGEKDSVAAERRLNTLPQTPVITVTGRAFSMLAILSKIKSEKMSSRLCSLGDLSGYEVRVEQLRRSDPGT